MPLTAVFPKEKFMILLATARRIFSTSHAFLRDRRGASAIEFAIVVPLMLAMYLGTLELGQGIETNKKVARSAAMIGDLVTQSTSLTKSQIDGILVVGESILQPYNRSRPSITITALRFNNATPPLAFVAWRRKIVDGVTSGTWSSTETVAVPTQLQTAGTFLIRVETDLNYIPIMTAVGDLKALGYKSAFANLPMLETYYLRPRQSAEIPCSDC